MTKQSTVLILGFGEMGHAMQSLLEPFHAVKIWNRSPIPDQSIQPLEESVSWASVIIFCLPTHAYEDMILNMHSLMHPQTLCIGIAKGLSSSGETAAEIFKKHLNHYALIYGPMISEELCAHKDGFADIAASSDQNRELVTQLFKPTNLHLKLNPDLIGVSWSAVLKNVYALGFGIIDELQLGKNLRGFFVVKALDEIKQITLSLGGLEHSSYGLAGLGDLETTGSSEDSRHHTLGRRIARGDFSDLYAEGVHTLLMVKKFQRFDWKRYRLFSTIEEIVSQKIEAKAGITALVQSEL